MTAIGELNRRLVLEAPSETADGAGGVTRLYDVVTTLWAQVTPVSARADIAAGSLGSVLRTRIVIRKRSDVSTRHRLLDGARIYRILSVRASADHRFLEIDAEEHQD
ncbi:MAG: phage head closure protein [Rhizobiales bacterium]|nr:phage head closure protein [Hyphomicrobiales bacterium]